MAIVVVMLVLVTMAIVVVMLVLVTMTIVVVMLVVMMLMLLLELGNSRVQRILTFHSRKNIPAVKLVPRSSDYNRLSVVLSYELHGRINLLVLGAVGMRKDYAGGVSNLVVIELAEVLHIHLTLIGIGNGGKAIQLRIVGLDRLNRLDNVRELTYSAGLDNYSVGMELLQDLRECLGKITDERAADASRVHLGDLYTRILQKSAVNADLSKLILDENYLLADVGLLEKLLYQGRLSPAEKARKNIYFRHFKKLPEGKPP